MNTPQEYLDSLTNFEHKLHHIKPTDFHLDRVQEALRTIGDPLKQIKILHIAGTKGKGSTCAMIASILAHAGLKVGLYTSPHLHHVNERIRILDKNHLHSSDDFYGSISDEDLTRILSQLRPVIAAIENKGSFLTYFEVLTLLAALYFQEQQVDVVVLETGLGGRLDATNAFDTFMAVITPISLDHVKILGNTLKQIAKEKAGIIKHSSMSVVIAPQEEASMDVLKERCHEFGIMPKIVHPMLYKQLSIALKGDHQLINAACAFEAVNFLKEKGFKIPMEAISDGLKQVRWQGRFEMIQEKPVIVVDGAHNPASSTALAKTILDEYRERRIILILGLSADKDIKAVCAPLTRVSEMIILTQAKHPRSHHFTEAEAKEIFADKKFHLTHNVKEALKLALSKARKEDVIIVTGSLFIVAEVRECINIKD